MLPLSAASRPSTHRRTTLETIHDESSSNTLSAAENATAQDPLTTPGPMARFQESESALSRRNTVNRQSFRKVAGIMRTLLALRPPSQIEPTPYVTVTDFAPPPIVPANEWASYRRSVNGDKLGPVPDNPPLGQTPAEFDVGMRALYGITRDHPIRRSNRYHKRQLSSAVARWQSPIPGRPLPFPRECTLHPYLQHNLFGRPPVVWSIGLDTSAVMQSGEDDCADPLWDEDFDQPATCPLVTHMYINGVAEDPNERFAWPMIVENKNGITCGDVYEKIYQNFQAYVGIDEYQKMNSMRREQMLWASQSRVQHIASYLSFNGRQGVEESELSMKRIDYLGHIVMFRGLEHHPNGEGWVLYVGRA